MNVLVDTSVVLRVLMGAEDPIDCWGKWERAYVSTLVRTEFFRTVDRLRLAGELGDEDRVQLRQNFEIFWRTCHRIPVSVGVLSRAEEPFPTVLGTLDALHLSSLLLAQQSEGIELTLLTHDLQLGRAALACGIRVLPE
jgi:predicted nucleic acid-binding protein